MTASSAPDNDRLMSEAGVPCTAYCDPAEQLANPLLKARGSFHELRDADGAFTVLNPPFRLSGTNCVA